MSRLASTFLLCRATSPVSSWACFSDKPVSPEPTPQSPPLFSFLSWSPDLITLGPDIRQLVTAPASQDPLKSLNVVKPKHAWPPLYAPSRRSHSEGSCSWSLPPHCPRCIPAAPRTGLPSPAGNCDKQPTVNGNYFLICRPRSTSNFLYIYHILKQ